MSVISPSNDALGQALMAYHQTKKEQEIKVSSPEAGSDTYKASYFFRDKTQMPVIEQIALSLAKGDVLDVGAAAGCHSLVLQNKGLTVLPIDISPNCVKLMKKRKLNALLLDVMEVTESFDTILLLMNGIGIAGTLKNLNPFLSKLKSLLKPGGILLFDSSDIIHLYTEVDDNFVPDLAVDYYGEIRFSFQYQKYKSLLFPWLYLDEHTAKLYIEEVGLKFEVLKRQAKGHYLAKCTKIS